ncbi:MAG TPA: hypothetical protein VNL17_14675 [Verrucomicrobiae bacterium]|nr:hypothetical protein [Verrucomicrobiae bacterium]
MTKGESILASRLLDQASVEFHEHGCNDMDPEYFEDLEPEDILQLVDGYNEWRSGGCGGENWEPVTIRNIGDDEWMAYLAHVIGRRAA